MAHIQERVSLLLSAHWFCYSHRFSSQSKLNHLALLSSAQITGLSEHIYSNAHFLFPQDDRYFLSGSLDGKLRLWNIPDKKVALWNEVDGQTRLITAANFCQNGKYAVIGTYDGRCIFYDTEVTSQAAVPFIWALISMIVLIQWKCFLLLLFVCILISAWNTTHKFTWGPPEAGTKLGAKSLALNLYLERIR